MRCSFYLSVGACVALVLVAPALAKDWEPSDPALNACLKNANASDPMMMDCFDDFAKREDQRLNANWKRLIGTFHGANSAQRSALVAEQRAWIAYRDASCRHYDLADGTLDKVMGATCYAQIVSERADAVQSLAQYYSEN